MMLADTGPPSVAACQGFGADPLPDDALDDGRGDGGYDRLEDRVIQSSAGDEHFL